MFDRVSSTRGAYSVRSAAARIAFADRLDRPALLNERNRARVQDRLALLRRRLRGQAHDRRVARLEHRACGSCSVEAGQAIVHDDDVRRELDRRPCGLGAAADRTNDLEAGLECEQELERRAVHVVVLHEQHADSHDQPLTPPTGAAGREAGRPS